MTRWLRILSGGLLLTLILQLCGFSQNCTAIRESVVRVHILANSDSETDQSLKLQVRDAVVTAGAGLLDGVTDPTSAQHILREALPMLCDVAQQCVYDNGYTYPVHGELVNMFFTTREYDSGTFPAGYYDALRFTIGEGAGRNWWCVMYPPLCVSAATDKDSLSQVLTEDQTTIVEQGQRFRVRFKVIEWLESLFCIFKS